MRGAHNEGIKEKAVLIHEPSPQPSRERAVRPDLVGRACRPTGG